MDVVLHWVSVVQAHTLVQKKKKKLQLLRITVVLKNAAALLGST